MDKPVGGPRKTLRAPQLRRGREIIPISDRVKLERVLGLTVSNNAAFDCDPNAGIVAYPAGCVVVVHNVRKNKQGHILSSSKKTITSLAFSSDGKYLATGECGHQPHVRVWDVQDKTQIAEFQGHKYGINCVAFSPNLKYVVSVGSQHDMIVNVWDWRNNIKVASNKVSCKVKALSFASNGNYFVTVGNRHVKFWYLEYSRSAKYKHEAVPLMGRSAILGDQRNNYFCDVACGKGNMFESTYSITKSGLLCEFNSRRLLDKWVELRTSSANSISVSENLMIIGCAEGIIRCFNPLNLNFISTLPRPHTLGIDVAKGIVGSKTTSSHLSNSKYPDAIAIALDEINKKVTCVYNDHSLYVWDIKDIKKVGKSHSFLYHSACIWGIEVCPGMNETEKNILPKGTFLTCSSDDTIRFWNLEPFLDQDTVYHKNIYSSELLKILYIDPELSYLCDTDLNSSGSNDKVDATYDGKNGVRCLRINPEGRYLASGDRSGNIRIHDLEFIEEHCKIEAHDSEVLCLEYSKPDVVNDEEKRYLASASRDRLIHVFDVKQDYAFQQTLDDHSSSITAVRFVQGDDPLQMISCGADKSIIFRKATYTPQLSLVREHHVVGKTTLYDMEVDVQQRNILTACQDRNIRVYSVANGKHTRCFRGSQGEDGTLIKVVLDPSGSFLATSCTDKSLYLYDYITGECLATMFGHSELVTGLKFSNDGRHLISVSGDGCIFVWNLPLEVTQTMLNKQVSIEGTGLPSLWQDSRKSEVAISRPLQLMEIGEDKQSEDLDLVNSNTEPVNGHSPAGYRFSIGQLPLWAKKQMLEKLPEKPANQNLPPPLPPRGRWAQRINGQGLVVRSYLDGDSVIQYPTDSTEISNSVNGNLLNNSNKAIEDFEISVQSMKEIMNGDSNNVLGDPIPQQPQVGNRTSNLRRSQNANFNNLRLEDLDAEDERSDSEISEMIFYPASEDGSDIADVSFHVCANNEIGAKDSLVPSQKSRLERSSSDVPIVNTLEHEANSDDEDASTLVDSDRSFLSSLCISTENLEKLGQREKFMKSNYESLEKSDPEENHGNLSDKSLYRQSISAKYLAASHFPPKRTLTNGISRSHATAERRTSTPTSKKREELLKALSDAKKKLENVGYRSGLSSSKSIADLHSTSDREMFLTPKYGRNVRDIRKSVSMMDLTSNIQSPTPMDAPEKTPKTPEIAAPLWNQSSRMYPETSPPSSPSSSKSHRQNQTPTNTVSRCSSSSSLQAKNLNSSTGNLYKTSSVYSLPNYQSPISRNQQNHDPRNRHSGGFLPSKPKAPAMISTVQLATDSSSDSSRTESPPTRDLSRDSWTPRMRNRCSSMTGEETQPLDPKVSPVFSASDDLKDLKMKSRSEWDLKNRSMDETMRSGSRETWHGSQYLSFSPRKSYMRPLKPSHSNVSVLLSTPNLNSRKEFNASDLLSCDPTSIPLTPGLCESIADNLSRITSFAMQVFQRVTLTPDIPPEDKSSMANTLAQGVWQAQQNLRPTVPPLNPWITTVEHSYDSNLQRLPGIQYPTVNGNSENPLRLGHGAAAQPDVINTMALLQQYSDKLLSIVEQKISNSQDKPNK